MPCRKANYIETTITSIFDDGQTRSLSVTVSLFEIISRFLNGPNGMVDTKLNQSIPIQSAWHYYLSRMLFTLFLLLALMPKTNNSISCTLRYTEIYRMSHTKSIEPLSVDCVCVRFFFSFFLFAFVSRLLVVMAIVVYIIEKILGAIAGDRIKMFHSLPNLVLCLRSLFVHVIYELDDNDANDFKENCEYS